MIACVSFHVSQLYMDYNPESLLGIENINTPHVDSKLKSDKQSDGGIIELLVLLDIRVKRQGVDLWGESR